MDGLEIRPLDKKEKALIKKWLLNNKIKKIKTKPLKHETGLKMFLPDSVS